MSDFSRREFLKRSAAAGVASGVALTGFGRNALASDVAQVGTMIDLTRCDGCKELNAPACVAACREENKDVFPEPIENIGNYWPQKKKEDWSNKRGLTSRLTPYNWTFVQKISQFPGAACTVIIRHAQTFVLSAYRTRCPRVL